mmetsp:Transcript_1693/g.3540  ORF Transcript_1693/g.3540 Transcript_1693/m.3540 type:complete len:262 (-) Transcript_1693:400-1185(-)
MSSKSCSSAASSVPRTLAAPSPRIAFKCCEARGSVAVSPKRWSICRCLVSSTRASTSLLRLRLRSLKRSSETRWRANSSSSSLPSSVQKSFARSRSTFPPSQIQPPSDPKSVRYRSISVSMAPFLISRDGRCGKKSLPTKKQRKMKSSIKRSRSNPPATEKSACSNSLRKYSRKMLTCSHWNGVCSVDCRSASIAAPPSASAPACRLSSVSIVSRSPALPPPFCAWPTNSRRIAKCGSCVASESMIRSASRPCSAWRVLGS